MGINIAIILYHWIIVELQIFEKNGDIHMKIDLDITSSDIQLCGSYESNDLLAIKILK
jgi:hypothetical protein